jgi:hypothetical protein
MTSPLYFGSDADILQGSWIFSVTLPLSVLNRQQLQYPDVLDNALRFVSSAPCSIYCQGIQLFKGTLDVLSATNRTVQVRVLINYSSVLKETKMNELDLTVINTAYTNPYTLASQTASAPENYDYVFTPVWNPNFWGEQDAKLDINKEMQNYWLIGRGNGQFLGQPITPFPKLTHVLQRIFALLGLTLSNQFQITTELKRLLLYSNASMCSKIGEFGMLHFKTASGLSETTVSEFLKQLCRKFALGVFFDLANERVDIIPFKTIIAQKATYDWTKKRLNEYEISQDIETPSVLGDKIKDSILPNDIEKLTQYDEYPSDFSAPEGVYTSGQNVWYHKNLVPIDPAIPSQNAVRQLTRARLNNYYTNTGAKGNKFESGIGTLIFSKMQGFMDVQYMPSVKLRGKYEPNEKEKYIGEDRLFFYRGLLPYPTGNNYPVSSSETYYPDNVRTHIPGASLSLDWNGTDGLYEQFWKENIAFLQTAQNVKMMMLLTISDIKNFTFDKKVRIGNQEYLVKKMKFTISQRGLQPVELELVR